MIAPSPAYERVAALSGPAPDRLPSAWLAPILRRTPRRLASAALAYCPRRPLCLTANWIWLSSTHMKHGPNVRLWSVVVLPPRAALIFCDGRLTARATWDGTSLTGARWALSTARGPWGATMDPALTELNAALRTELESRQLVRDLAASIAVGCAP